MGKNEQRDRRGKLEWEFAWIIKSSELLRGIIYDPGYRFCFLS